MTRLPCRVGVAGTPGHVLFLATSPTDYNDRPILGIKAGTVSATLNHAYAAAPHRLQEVKAVSNRNPVLAAALEQAFPASAEPDWADVLGRSGAAEPLDSAHPVAPGARRRSRARAGRAGADRPVEDDQGNRVLERALAAIGDGPSP